MTTDPVPAGSVIGPFTVEALIGRGGMGDVYRAADREHGRAVALKLLRPTLAAQEEFAARFVREARVMQTLEHPAIVAVFDAGEACGRLYLAMRLINGISLKDLLAQGRPSTEESLRILARLAEALDYAHSRGVIHRDVKPSNILLDLHGQPVLVDFGLAKAMGEISVTISSRYLGTPAYMAPEQAAGEPVSHRADLYSAACVAFEMLTGDPPYPEQDPLALLVAHGTHPVPRASERDPALPESVDAVFRSALAKSPTDRYPSAGAFIDALTAVLTVADRPRRVRRRISWLIAAAALLVAAVAGAALVLPIGPEPGLPPAGSDQAVQRVPTSAVAPRGQLLYQAALDGTDGSFVDTVGREKDPAKVAVRFLPGRLELAALVPQTNAGTDLNLANGIGVTTYVGDIELSTAPGSDGNFCWGLRWAVAGKLAYELCVDTEAEFVQLMVWNRPNKLPITPRIDLPEFQTGRIVTLTVVVRESRLTLLVDGQLAADVEDHQVPVAQTIPGLDVYSKESGATVNIHGLSLYALTA
jgi:serine/threonine-protein kinase